MTSLSSLVKAKIKATVTDFKEVAVVSDMKALMANSVLTPGCYIYRERNSATANNLVNGVSQLRTEHIALMIVTRNVSDASGANAGADSESLCDLVMAQLLGFVAADRYTMMEYVGGTLVAFNSGLHYWRELYQAASLIRST